MEWEMKIDKNVYLVGAGPGAFDLITLRGLKLIEACDVLIYDYLAGEALLQASKAHCEKLYVGKRSGHHSMVQAEINQLLVEKSQQLRPDGRKKMVVRLKGGDSFVFGRGGEEVEALLQAGISYEVVPGITSAIAAPELAGIPVTHRGLSASVTIISGHSKEHQPTTEDFETLAKLQGTLVVLMGVANAGAIAQGLMAAGKSQDTPIAFIEQASAKAQKLVRATLQEAGALSAAGKVQAPAVLLIGNAAAFPKSKRVEKAKSLAVMGTAHFVELLQKQQAQGEGSEAVWEFRDCHNLQVVSCRESLPKDVTEQDWIFFTSGYGVKHFFHLCQKEHRDLRQFSKVGFAAIGKDTASYLEQHGIYADFVAKTAEGRSFGREFAAFIHESGQKKPKSLLLFRAKKASKGLCEALEAEGFSFRDIALYDTEPIEAVNAKLAKALVQGKCPYDGFVWGSRSGAKAFFDQLSKLGEAGNIPVLLQDKLLYGMGSGTRDFLIEQGVEAGWIRTPQSPGMEQLYHCIAQEWRQE